MILILHGYFKLQIHFLLHLGVLGVCVKESVGYLRPKIWILACIIDIHYIYFLFFFAGRCLVGWGFLVGQGVAHLVGLMI